MWGCHGYAPRGEKVGGGDATCRLCRVPGRAAQAVEGSVSRVTPSGVARGRRAGRPVGAVCDGHVRAHFLWERLDIMTIDT